MKSQILIEKKIHYRILNEFYEYNSETNGVGGLHKYLNDYDGWLKKLDEDYRRIPNEEKGSCENIFFNKGKR